MFPSLSQHPANNRCFMFSLFFPVYRYLLLLDPLLLVFLMGRVAEASAGAMASKAGRLRQKALSVVDTVQTLSSHNSSNSCTITVKVRTL